MTDKWDEVAKNLTIEKWEEEEVAEALRCAFLAGKAEGLEEAADSLAIGFGARVEFLPARRLKDKADQIRATLSGETNAPPTPSEQGG